MLVDDEVTKTYSICVRGICSPLCRYWLSYSFILSTSFILKICVCDFFGDVYSVEEKSSSSRDRLNAETVDCVQFVWVKVFVSSVTLAR